MLKTDPPRATHPSVERRRTHAGPGFVARARQVSSRLRTLIPHPRAPAVLASTGVFAGCTRRQLFRVARWGDIIEARPGEVFVREGYPDYWFLAVLSGSVRLTSAGRVVRTLHRGDHFGEISIVGFRPQTATATAAEPTLLFVLGRRYLLSLALLDASIQRALFPAVRPDTYRAFVRELQAQGQSDWEKFIRPRRREAISPADPSRPAGRRLSWHQAVQLLSGEEGQRDVPIALHEERPLRPGRRLALLGAVVALLATAAIVYHPPVAVVTPAAPIDVVEDISITGARVHRPTGSYLLTPIHVERPTLGRAMFDFFAGREIVRTTRREAEHVDPDATERSARDAYLGSHRRAVDYAKRLSGVDATGVKVVIRDRDIKGPSGGLIYALAIADMLGGDDLAAGRVIAATGDLLDDGRIGGVGFVAIKADVARAGGARVFFVPVEHLPDARGAGLAVEGVESLEEALRFLRSRLPAPSTR